MLTAVYDTGRSTVMEIQKDAQYLKEEMVGCIYRHFKGGLYIVTDVVVNSESLEIEVIYKDFTPSQLTWSRDSLSKVVFGAFSSFISASVPWVPVQAPAGGTDQCGGADRGHPV